MQMKIDITLKITPKMVTDAQGNEKTQGSLLVHAPLSAAVYFIYDSAGNSGGAAQLYFFQYAERAGVYRCG